jgi:hypothetical protein
MDPELIGRLKLLSDPQRLRILGALAGKAATPRELAETLALPLRDTVRQVGLLRRFGLVRPVDAGSREEAVEIGLDALQAVGRGLDALESRTPGPSFAMGPDGEPLPAEDAKVLRSYLEDGRLAAIPAATRKRMVVLRWLLDQVFTEDRAYPEKEVNQRLALFHPDVASLRRYMVDAGMVSREAMMYRRERGVEGRPGGSEA